MKHIGLENIMDKVHVLKGYPSSRIKEILPRLCKQQLSLFGQQVQYQNRCSQNESKINYHKQSRFKQSLFMEIALQEDPNDGYEGN